METVPTNEGRGIKTPIPTSIAPHPTDTHFTHLHIHTHAQIADMRADFQQENEEILATIRELSQEVNLQTLIMDSCIPKEYQEQLESCAVWHEDTGEWHMV